MNGEGRLSQELGGLYRHRFDDSDLAYKAQLWQVLCDRFFQRFIRPSETVLDLGAGSCEFINAIRCERKIAVDLNPNTNKHAVDAEVVLEPSTALSTVSNDSVDVVFTSNFFEHLPTKDDLLRTLGECHRILRPSGKLLVLMPNVRYLPGRYWDYFDHHIPLSHVSLAEAMALRGFEVALSIPRFLPYTVKDRKWPRTMALVKLYLRMPFVWPLVGRQMFLCARPREHSGPDNH